MSEKTKPGIAGICGGHEGDGAIISLPAEAIEVLDLLTFRWRQNRGPLTEAIRATEFGAETVELVEALVSRWIQMGLGDFGVEKSEGFGAKCREGVNE